MASEPFVLVLFGPPEVVDDAVRKRCAAFRDAAADAEILRYDAPTLVKDPPILTDFFSSRPLLGGPRLLVCSGVTDSHGKLLEALSNSIPDSATPDRVILASTSLKSTSALVKAARAERRIAVEACAALERAQYDWDALVSAAVDAESDPPHRARIAAAAAAAPPAATQDLALQFELLGARPGARLTDYESVLPSDAALASTVASALIAGDRSALLHSWRQARENGTNPLSFTLEIGRSLNDMHAALAENRPFWAARDGFAAMKRRRPDLSRRIQSSIEGLYALELRGRTGKALEPMELERLCVRLGSLLS